MKVVIEVKDKKDIGELLYLLNLGERAVFAGWPACFGGYSKAQQKRSASVLRRIGRQLHHKNIKVVENKWKFIYDEEVLDSWGRNFLGVISNGKDTLFYHIVPESNGGTEICHVFSSLQCLLSGDEPEVSYPWTSDNDDKLLEALNSLRDSSRLCGENSILGEIDFQDYNY